MASSVLYMYFVFHGRNVVNLATSVCFPFPETMGSNFSLREQSVKDEEGEVHLFWMFCMESDF